MNQLSSEFFVPGQSLVKYGKEEEMRALMESGEVYFSAASSFNNDAYTDARRDDELCRRFSGKVQLEVGNRIVSPCADAVCRLASSRDYYIYCLSKSLDTELFRKIPADACAVFLHGRNFCQRCIRAFGSENPEFSVWVNDVSYVDTHDIRATNVWTFNENRIKRLCGLMGYSREEFDRSPLNDEEIYNIWLRKDAEFKFQQEYRIMAWRQPHLTEPYKKIYLGPLWTDAALYTYDEKSGLFLLARGQSVIRGSKVMSTKTP